MESTFAPLPAHADLPVVPLGDAAAWVDLHATLAAAREASPFGITDAGLPVALRFAEVEYILKSDQFEFGDLIAAVGQTEGPFYDWWHETISAFNPPAHTRLRRLLAAAFTARRVNDLRPTIRRVVEDALEPCLERGYMDIVDFAHVLPMRIMGGVLGIPREDVTVFDTLTDQLASGFNVATSKDPVGVANVNSALKELQEYAAEMVRDRRAHPKDDIVSTLVQERDGIDRLTDAELVAHIVFMIFAGHDTTKGATQIATMLLAKHPDQTALIRENPDLSGAAVDEVMRYESPVVMTTRQPLADLEIEGVPFVQGRPIGVVLVSAARDPRGFERADQFDICRTERRAIGFGSGIHFCLGANLAKAELQEAVRGLATRTASIELTHDVAWQPFKTLRGFDELRLAVTPS
jgi:cytochrome P450